VTLHHEIAHGIPQRRACCWSLCGVFTSAGDVRRCPQMSYLKLRFSAAVQSKLMQFRNLTICLAVVGNRLMSPWSEKWSDFDRPPGRRRIWYFTCFVRGKKVETPFDKFGTPAEGYTAVAFTMRLTETYHFWTKNNPANVQLVPEPFAEINEQMARDLGISAGDPIRISTPQGAHICRAMVTKRLPALQVGGKTCLPGRNSLQLGLPRHC
jgi:anaerobic selenocysteine-containing dehydrogenase